MAIFDAHAHPGDAEELEIRKKHRITTFLCATDPESAVVVEALCRESRILFPTYGLHPWYADKFELEAMLPYLQQGNLLGEIGMDSAWCEVPEDRQRAVFLEQLKLAAGWDMPVILHTKGQEQEVLSCIEPYSMPFLVHWYSSEQYLEGYLEKDCYFSIGPDALFNPAVQRLVEAVELNRLLVETDGMEAVRWAAAQGKGRVHVENKDLPDILRGAAEYIGHVKGLSVDTVETQIQNNFIYLRDYRSC